MPKVDIGGVTLYSILDAFLKAKKTHTVMVTVDEGDQLVSTPYPRVTVRRVGDRLEMPGLAVVSLLGTRYTIESGWLTIHRTGGDVEILAIH